MLNNNQILRYSRQIILKDFGIEGQEKLLGSKVLVIGSGGLGSPALYYLAAAGVGTIGIADFDTVTLSNLQRQILHFTEDLGKKKVDSAADKLQRLNPDVKIVKHPSRMMESNIEDVISGYDIVIDATDTLTARFLISDCCYFLKKPLVEGAVVDFQGTLFTIIPGITPCYRCIYPVPPVDGEILSCADVGIMGAIAGMVGAWEALEAIKVLLRIGQTISGRILFFNGLSMKFDEVLIDRSPDCPLCGPNPTVTELVENQIRCKPKIIINEEDT